MKTKTKLYIAMFLTVCYAAGNSEQAQKTEIKPVIEVAKIVIETPKPVIEVAKIVIEPSMFWTNLTFFAKTFNSKELQYLVRDEIGHNIKLNAKITNIKHEVKDDWTGKTCIRDCYRVTVNFNTDLENISNADITTNEKVVKNFKAGDYVVLNGKLKTVMQGYKNIPNAEFFDKTVTFEYINGAK